MRHLATRLLQICFYYPSADSKKDCFLFLFLAQRGFSPDTPVHLYLKTHTSQLQFGLELNARTLFNDFLRTPKCCVCKQCNFFFQVLNYISRFFQLGRLGDGEERLL